MQRNQLSGLLLFCVAACGGLDYDVEYDCAQSISCARSRGQQTVALDTCIDVTEAFVDNLSDAQEKKLEEIFALCKSRTGCDYADCVADTASLTAEATRVPFEGGALARAVRSWF